MRARLIGEPVDRLRATWTLDALRGRPTLVVGQTDDLKVEMPGLMKIWLSRMTVADGAAYDNEVTVEMLFGGAWVTVASFEAVSSGEDG